jgi:hypothetical protein
MLLLMEGFEGYGQTPATTISSYLTQRGWTVTQGGSDRINVLPGRISVFCAAHYYNSGSYTWSLTNSFLPTTNNTLIFGIAILHDGGAYTSVLSFYDDVTLGVNVSIVISTGVITVKTGASTLATWTSPLQINTWYYFEVKTLCDASVGTVEVRINGTTIISLTGQDTKAGTHDYHNGISFYSSNQVNHQRFDDIYVCDGSGSTLNDFQGNCHIYGTYPVSDSDTIEWTPSTGVTHYNLVNEVLADGITYVESSISALKDLYNFKSMTGILSATTPILGIQINTTCETSVGISTIIEPVILSSSVEITGPDTTILSTYVAPHYISTVDPATNLAWTINGLNSAQFGIKAM